MTSFLRRGSAALAVLLFFVFVLPLSSARAATPTDSALDWLTKELAANGHQLPFKGAPTFTDWGLSIDFVLALAGGGRAAAGETQATVANISANAANYVTGGDFAPDDRYAGPMGKLLYMTKVFGVDSTNLGGLNIENELRALMQTSGSAQPGRFTDHSDFGDFSNGFGQAFDILGLARTTGGVPPEAITFLLAQQCPAGGFRLFYDANPSCGSDDQADPDATGLAIDALVGQPGASSAINRAASWLVAQQDASGAFGGSGPTASLNANSTGIIAQALRAIGQTASADKAGAWIQSLQLTSANASAASADVGAIAYDPGQRDDAIANGLPAERDPFRRATSQGVLALPEVVLPCWGRRRRLDLHRHHDLNRHREARRHDRRRWQRFQSGRVCARHAVLRAGPARHDHGRPERARVADVRPSLEHAARRAHDRDARPLFGEAALGRAAGEPVQHDDHHDHDDGGGRDDHRGRGRRI